MTPLSKTTLASDEQIKDTEHHFRVFAGPGAGKTHWLVGQIRHVARVSPRLVSGAKICCISYTNVAVEEIRLRLGNSATLCEVSTIHAFLYKFVVRPYLHLLLNDSGEPIVNHGLVDGHDEHRPRRGIVMQWLQSFGSLKVSPGMMSLLRTVRWCKNEQGVWKIEAGTSASINAAIQRQLNVNLQTYKQFYWQEGIIDHDDVLYLADLVMAKVPHLNAFIAARFPYIFIDEFQDTNPVQTTFIKWVAGGGTTVGVIGDREQSIYGFQGAMPKDFEEFFLPGIADYVIEGNRRSTKTIIQFLNLARHDGMSQKHITDDEGEPVIVHVGDAAMSYRAACEWVEGETLAALAFKHTEVNQLRDPDVVSNDKAWEEFYDEDPVRAQFMEHIIRASELGSRERLGPAVKEVLAAIRLQNRRVREPLRLEYPLSDIERRGIATATLEWLVTHRATYPDKPILDLYNGLSAELSNMYAGLRLVAVRGGKFERFANSYTYQDLASHLRFSEETRSVRTIHQSKGAEFDNVLLRLANEKQLLRLCGMASAETEYLKAEGRTYYVGASRAKKRLIVSVPSLSKKNLQVLQSRGIKVVNIYQDEKAAADSGLTLSF